MGKEIFLYNEKTHTLHIEGLCPHASRKKGYTVFYSEDEALAHDGRAVGMCKLCQCKRGQYSRLQK